MTLQEFFKENKDARKRTKKIAVSNRIADENGNPFLFTIRGLNTQEYDNIRNSSNIITKDGKPSFNTSIFCIELIIESTIEPNFKKVDTYKELGFTSPQDYVKGVFLAGEIDTYVACIQKFNGFNTNIDDLIKEAKN